MKRRENRGFSMADAMKHMSFFDLTSIFSIIRMRRTVAFVYGLMFAFVLYTVFLAFNSSYFSYSPWFTNIFTPPDSLSSSSPTENSSYRSQFSSFSYFFTNTSFHQQKSRTFPYFPPPSPENTNFSRSPTPVEANQTQSLPLSPPILLNPTSWKSFAQTQVLKPNRTVTSPSKSPVTSVQNQSLSVGSNSSEKGNSGVKSNFSASLSRKQSDESHSGVPVKQGKDDFLEKLVKCDFFYGEWVRDESYPLYKPGSCSFIDEQFNCFLNGRPDQDYHKLKWKPKGCDLPRLDGRLFLNLLRGKRLVFVGDSLNRNMWESLVCILRNSAKNQKNVYEANGRYSFRGEASYSFIFEDYKLSVEFFVSPFLVQEWEMQEKNGRKKETLRLDLVGSSSDQYKSADIIIFNTGHWWTHEKTSKGEDYYQEGSHVYRELNVLEAFRKALTTWGRWIDAHVNPKKSMVFFRGYSESHFSGGQWNSGGACDNETQPIKTEKFLRLYEDKMIVLEKVLKGMKTHVSYLNITRMTDFRKDGHPSIYRKRNQSEADTITPLMFQDCSHWCLPGVPDAWNEALYAELLIKEYKMRRQQQQKRT